MHYCYLTSWGHFSEGIYREEEGGKCNLEMLRLKKGHQKCWSMKRLFEGKSHTEKCNLRNFSSQSKKNFWNRRGNASLSQSGWTPREEEEKNGSRQKDVFDLLLWLTTSFKTRSSCEIKHHLQRFKPSAYNSKDTSPINKMDLYINVALLHPHAHWCCLQLMFI